MNGSLKLQKNRKRKKQGWWLLALPVTTPEMKAPQLCASCLLGGGSPPCCLYGSAWPCSACRRHERRREAATIFNARKQLSSLPPSSVRPSFACWAVRLPVFPHRRLRRSNGRRTSEAPIDASPICAWRSWRRMTPPGGRSPPGKKRQTDVSCPALSISKEG